MYSGDRQCEIAQHFLPHHCDQKSRSLGSKFRLKDPTSNVYKNVPGPDRDFEKNGSFGGIFWDTPLPLCTVRRLLSISRSYSEGES